MKLNLQHAKEFAKILDANELKAESMDAEGQFHFKWTAAEKDQDLTVDPSMIATLIQMKKSVDRGETPEEQLQASVARIRAELKL